MAALYWHNISDGYFNTAAIGALAVSACDTQRHLRQARARAAIRGNVSHGDGVYKSVDAGLERGSMPGLSESRHIGKIVIHPKDPDTHVYVAAFGRMRLAPNPKSGAYTVRAMAAAAWERVLYKSARAGSHDVALDVNNPRILFAAIWQAQRYPHKLENGGPDCGLWRSFDGGDSWQDITRRPGLPAGRIGQNRSWLCRRRRLGRVWACIEAAKTAPSSARMIMARAGFG